MRQGSITDFFKSPSPTKSPATPKTEASPPVLVRKDLDSLSLPNHRLKLSPVTPSFPPTPASQPADTEAEFDLPSFTLPAHIRDAQGHRPDDPGYDPTTLWVPVDRKRTPAQEQYWKIKAQHFDSILLFKLGKFYELFWQDAVITQAALELNWMGDKRKCHVGFPERALEKNAAKLVDLGYKVVVVEQTETPEQLKQRNTNSGKKEKAVSREVTEVYTKGTYVDEGNTLGGEQRFLAAIVQAGENAACVFAECCTSKFYMLSCPLKQLYTAISQTQPVEFLYHSSLLSPSLLRQLKSLPSRPLLTQLRESALWDSSSVVRHFPIGLPSTIASLDCQLLLSAIAGTCSYLSKNYIADKVLPFAEWQAYSPSLQRYMALDFRALDALEVLEVACGTGSKREGSLLHCLDQTVTPYGKRMMKRWVCLPLVHIPAILQRQQAVYELYIDQTFVVAFEQACRPLLDLERLLLKVAKYSTQQNSSAVYFENIQARQVKDFEVVLQQIRTLIQVQMTLDASRLQSARISALLSELFPDLSPIEREFEGVFQWIDENRVEPGRFRCEEYEKARELEEAVKEELQEYLKQQQSRLKCSEIAFVDVKYRYEMEIPVESVVGKLRPEEYELTSARKGYERFLTPALKRLVTQLEKAEEQLKLAFKPYLAHTFSQFLAHRALIQQASSAVAELDCLCALAKAARTYQQDLCVPEFDEKETALFEAVGLRHPVLAGKVRDFVPNDVVLTSVKPAMVLTGPNMGGKSTLLRQVCVAAVLAQIGALVPAKSLKMSIVDRIFTRMGAKDDLFLGKSTFAVEVEEAAEVFRAASPRSLVIMDELGRGTGTSDGAAIAYMTLRRILHQFACRMIFTTHYYMLMDQISELSGVQLSHMSANVSCDEVLFLYKLAAGVCPASFGLNVARLAGVPASILARAKSVAAEIEDNLRIRRVLQFIMKSPQRERLRQELMDRLG